ncbi:von Willebrand factor type A domain protein [Roseovarius albus]|uniref:von Willebrand factor type A domain protein n=1 Tax=Roseovarius albus TaxID=1247867 RepID=A0A1X6ZYG4_9RHOB|nr:VWA domain-containing protein [Roseovarius albus]SLN65233.1 von Willebrand factor type A domain protein [Roseovarius albus]
MALRPLDLMEPEETVGNIWHGLVSEPDCTLAYPEAMSTLSSMSTSLLFLFRALGGSGAVEIAPAPATRSQHRIGARRKLGNADLRQYQASFDSEKLLLPPDIAIFPDADLNRATYLWLAASAALSDPREIPEDPLLADWTQVQINSKAAESVYARCPGLRHSYEKMRIATFNARPDVKRPAPEADLEAAICDVLAGLPFTAAAPNVASNKYHSFAPVPFWLSFQSPGSGGLADANPEEITNQPPAASTTTRKLGLRKDASEAMRKDSFIIHRFEAILSWVESMNLNRSVDDDDDENAKKAADDQDNITLSRLDRRAATRLRLHLDLSPADADHERLAGEYTYPEWNHRSRSYMPNHCRVLDAEVVPDPDNALVPNERRMREVRRQFATLHPRRILRPRQLDGTELDLDAVIAAQIDLQATGQSSDRIYQSLRQIDRDLSVAILLDTSRSTEAAVGDTSVIDVARDALAALSGGIDAAGDRLGIWGFSSLRRDRVFLSRCKAFETPLSPEVQGRICSLQPGHYTRLGAAIRYVSAQLQEEPSSRKLLLVLTDGKPNDLDHYEGQHGIEDSHMAVREARNIGQIVHGIIVDEDGQDWFARIFGRGGFTLLPQPERLLRALPDIYRSLTQET